FSDEMKKTVVEAVKQDLGQVDCVVYSLASPRRVHPRSGEVFKSVLKPIGDSYSNKNLNTSNGQVNEVSIEPANDEEIAHTTAVMGGEDWEMWIDALQKADALAPGVRTLAYSYIGPSLTWPIYKNGTIGRAKEDLERAQRDIDSKLAPLGGKAWVSVNKALVTQASSAIPVVPLYISILYKAMKAAGSHEECAEQMDRLFRERLNSPTPPVDEAGRLRLDDWEMADDMQKLVGERWNSITTENLAELADFTGYQQSFHRLFGFGLEGVDYSADVDIHVPIPSIKE
ncbi:MAG: enoyl-ACP reductase FabV, partial [Verrucomicrobiota bacterium]